MFLQPRIPRHPLYPEVKAALLADKTKPFLVCFCPGNSFNSAHARGVDAGIIPGARQSTM